MQQYLCVGPSDPDYNDEQHIHDTWHELYYDRADAFWVWQSFRLCRRTPRRVIIQSDESQLLVFCTAAHLDHFDGVVVYGCAEIYRGTQYMLPDYEDTLWGCRFVRA